MLKEERSIRVRRGDEFSAWVGLAFVKSVDSVFMEMEEKAEGLGANSGKG